MSKPVPPSAPLRPPGVPPDAEWLADWERWQRVEVDEEGRRHGTYQVWRADGALYMESHYRADTQHGPFVVYHPSGEVARRGTYENGGLEGAVVAIGSDQPTRETLRVCCVPPGAWRMEALWQGGNLIHEHFFDREDQPLLSDGRRVPVRPDSVPEDAQFDEWSGRWSAGYLDGATGRTEGTWRWWNVAGWLDEEAEYGEGSQKKHSRAFDSAGQLRHDLHYDSDGKLHGPHFRRYLNGEATPYADERIRAERGGHHQGQPVGIWTFADQSDQVLYRRARGEPSAGVTDGPAFRDESHPAPAWVALAQQLAEEGQLRAAVCAQGRAVGMGNDPAALHALVATIAIEPSPAAATSQNEFLAKAGETEVGAVLDALVNGADLATVFRTLAALTKSAPLAARDFAEVSVRLAPERPGTYITRALVRLDLGDRDGACADGDRLQADAPETAGFLRDYLRILFAPTPGTVTPDPLPDSMQGMPETPAQPLERIQAVVALYATRLQRLREALGAALARAGLPSVPAWLPPDRSALLPDGPVPLRAFTATILDETETGTEETQIAVDETLATDGWAVPTLLRTVRAQTAGLRWLCWSTGLAEIAMPTALTPPPEFAAAAAMAVARCWRARDAVNTGGLKSLTSGVASFVWEGIDLDDLPKVLAPIVAEEMLEVRSIFLWLISPENVSPFQQDIRQA